MGLKDETIEEILKTAKDVGLIPTDVRNYKNVLKIKKLRDNATIPEQATKFAAGWDVTAAKVEQVEDDLVICYLGFGLDIPEGYKLVLVPRSSLTKTKWILQNSPGQGDSDYKGEYQYRFRALPISYGKRYDSLYTAALVGYDSNECLYYPEFPYKEGDRIGQVFLEKVLHIEFEEVEELTETDRGEGGFGSTGK